ncbi:hypothetical protein PPROV_001115900 [Pycnococcus provasolii]|uniref:Amino acid permease/ SLC12A domain-containing protein n=2 Tax=Pycnococcus provasolii TaxID=41880 RepID=A0A830I3Z5_9CHLO|nr:hypothetical protein PPROV_001115900 [Pycnococcus provasolii]
MSARSSLRMSGVSGGSGVGPRGVGVGDSPRDLSALSPLLPPPPHSSSSLFSSALGGGSSSSYGSGSISPPPDDGRPQGASSSSSSSSSLKPRGSLNTFVGVFAPNVVSMFGVILYLRVGWTVGQVGFIGAVLLTFLITFMVALTAMSLSVIATNGRVSGGGVYFLTSRTLGPEFGGAIGFIFFAASVVSSALSLKGFAEQFVRTFDTLVSPTWPAYWTEFVVATAALYVAVLLNVVDVKYLGRLNIVTFAFMMGTVVLCSACLLLSGVFGGDPSEGGGVDIGGRGFRWHIMAQNLEKYGGLLPFWDPKYTHLRPHPTCSPRAEVISETGGGAVPSIWQVFAVFFNGFSGFTSGANMSGDLRDPSKSIPKGTIASLAFVVVVYIFLMFLLNGVYTRAFLVCNTLSMLDAIPSDAAVKMVNTAILLASLFGANNTLAGASRVWSALMADDVLGLRANSSNGGSSSNGSGINNSNGGGDGSATGKKYGLAHPHFSLALCTICTQASLFVGNLDALAPISSLCFLLAYAILNLACFTLRITSSPNFRPAFRHFSWQTSIAGVIMCIAAMCAIDVLLSLIVLLAMFTIFYLLALRSPPKKWGSIHQALIFQQVRKYLLKLESPTETHVKFWRPGVLLLSNGLLDGAGGHLTPATGSSSAALEVLPPSPTYDSRYLHQAEAGMNDQMLTNGVAASAIKLADELKKGGMYCIGHVADSLANATSELRHLNRVVQRLRVKAFPQTTIATGDHAQLTGAINIVLGARLGHLRPHTLMCRYAPSERMPSADYAQLAADALRLGMHFQLIQGIEHLLAPDGKESTTPRLDVYHERATVLTGDEHASMVPELSASFSLALVNAYVLTRSARWRHARVRVVLLVADTGDADDVESAVAHRVFCARTLLRELRIDAEVVARVVPPGSNEPFPRHCDVQRWSQGASLAFVPVTSSVLNDSSWIARLDNTDATTPTFPIMYSIGSHVVMTTEL